MKGKNKDAAALMLEQAQAYAAAGAKLLVLKAILSTLGGANYRSSIDSNNWCWGSGNLPRQVLVLLGINPGKPSTKAAVKVFVRDMKAAGRVPSPKHGFASW